MKHLFKICILLALTGCSQYEPSPKTLWNDYQARQEVKAEKYEESLVRYFALLESDGGRAGTHSNIGVLLSKLQKPEDAQKSLQHALTLAGAQKDPQSLFAVNYNLGVFFGTQKKVQEALLHYQAALEIVPASMEVKTNIELLIQQQQQDQKDQKNKEGQGEGQNQPDDKSEQNKSGDKGDNKDKKNQDSKGDQKDEKDPKDGEGEKPESSERQNSPKYKPRPFQGDQLSEGDVKKILGELKNQEQKIRANFDKKEKGKSRNNEKDW